MIMLVLRRLGALVLRLCLTKSMYQNWRESSAPHNSALIVGIIAGLWLGLMSGVVTCYGNLQRNMSHYSQSLIDSELTLMALVTFSLPCIILIVRLCAILHDLDHKK